MRYRFMMQLFGLRLDKRQFERDFGMSVEPRSGPWKWVHARVWGFRHRQRRRADADAEGPLPGGGHDAQFFIGVNNLRDQARAALTGEERELIFGDGK